MGGGTAAREEDDRRERKVWETKALERVAEWRVGRAERRRGDG